MKQVVIDLQAVRQAKLDDERTIRRLLIKLMELGPDLRSISHLPEIEKFVVVKTALEKNLRQKVSSH